MNKVIITVVLILLLAAMVALAVIANGRIGVREEETIPRTTPRPEEPVPTETPVPEQTAPPEEEQPLVLTFEDLAPFVRLEDVRIPVGSQVPRLTEFAGILFPEVVTSVSASTTGAIDTAAPGEYDILYAYTVDEQMYRIWRDALGSAEEIQIPEEAQGTGVLVREETIPYAGLVPGTSYTVKTEYRVLEEGEDPAASFGTLLETEEGGASQESAFTPEEPEGEVTASVELDISALRSGQTLRRITFFIPAEEEGTEHAEQTVEAVCHVFVEQTGPEETPEPEQPEPTPDTDRTPDRPARTSQPLVTASPRSTPAPTSSTAPEPIETDTPDGPGGDEPGGDEPGGDEPGGDEPGGDEPGGDTPGGDEPGGDEPGGDTPGGDTPGGDTPGGGEAPVPEDPEPNMD